MTDRPRHLKAILLTANSALALKAVYGLKALGYQCHVISTAPLKDMRSSRYVSSVTSVPQDSSDEALAALMFSRQPDIVMAVEVAAQARLHRLMHNHPALPVFPCSDAALLDALDNKARFITLAETHAVPVPLSRTAETAAGAKALAQDIGFPLMTKSLYGESGRGVTFIKNTAALDTFLIEKPPSAEKPLQLQKFITGPTVGLNLVAREGIIHAWSSYTKLDGDTLQFDARPEVLAAVRPLIEGTAFSGLANFDLIRTADNQLYVIECNPRVWYNMQADRWLGLNYVAVGIRARTETPQTPLPTASKAIYIFPFRLLRDFLKLKKSVWTASRASWGGLWEVISDPLCQLRKL